VTGDWDYILKVVITDLREFQAFLIDRLTALPELQNLKSTIILKTVKNTPSLVV
jgi:DNA-binding Lrp family transcriptional regulator